jgi:hypothetical protein
VETAVSLGDPRRALKTFAVVQAQKGDLRGARETIAPVGHSDRILEAVAARQMQSGDFDSTLRTAQEICPANIANPLLDLADALRERGELSRVSELASHVTNPKVANLFLEYVRLNKSNLENIPTIEPNVRKRGYFLVENTNSLQRIF